GGDQQSKSGRRLNVSGELFEPTGADAESSFKTIITLWTVFMAVVFSGTRSVFTCAITCRSKHENAVFWAGAENVVTKLQKKSQKFLDAFFQRFTANFRI